MEETLEFRLEKVARYDDLSLTLNTENLILLC